MLLPSVPANTLNRRRGNGYYRPSGMSALRFFQCELSHGLTLGSDAGLLTTQTSGCRERPRSAHHYNQTQANMSPCYSCACLGISQKHGVAATAPGHRPVSSTWMLVGGSVPDSSSGQTFNGTTHPAKIVNDDLHQFVDPHRTAVPSPYFQRWARQYWHGELRPRVGISTFPISLKLSKLAPPRIGT